MWLLYTWRFSLKKRVEKIGKVFDVAMIAVLMIGVCYAGAIKRFVNTKEFE